jgi:hypothetical protein
MALERKMLSYFMTICNILLPFGIIYGRLVLFVVIWYIFHVLTSLEQEKSGNPGFKAQKCCNEEPCLFTSVHGWNFFCNFFSSFC